VTERPVALPPSFNGMGSSVMSRPPAVEQTSSLQERLADAAARLRKEARGIPAGIERERILQKVRRAETALRVDRWLNSGELQPPK
jgi:hypothetical protein